MKNFRLDNENKITTGFKIPDSYFESFSEKINNKILTEDSAVIPIQRNRLNWLYVAAAVLILALSLPILNIISSNSNEIDAQSIENYITYKSKISDDIIVDLLETEDIEKINIDDNLSEAAIETALTNNTNLIHYIVN